MLIGRIRNSNMIYKAPKDMSSCQDLHVRVGEDLGTRTITSAWFPSPEEIRAMADGHPIHLHVCGSGHPVVSLSVSPDA